MIHWGSSIPCTLYLNQCKVKDIYLPDTTSWDTFSSDVTRNLNISPVLWQYTYSNNLNDPAVWRSDMASNEGFQRVMSGFSSGEVLKINVSDVVKSERNNGSVAAHDLTGVRNGVYSHDFSHSGPNFQQSVETAVQKFLSDRGADLIRDLAHSHRVCCCALGHEIRRSPEEFVIPPGRLTEPDIENGAVNSGHDNIIQNGQSSVLPDSTDMSEHNNNISGGNDMNRERACSSSHLISGRSRKLDELSPCSSSKRLKAMLGDKDYLLAPSQNTTLTVIPGQTITASWTLLTKHGISSRWDVVDDGGTLPHVGHVTWSPSSTPNIITLSVDFVAPAQEGEYNSTWCLVQDSLRREVFVFCCVKVHCGPLAGASGRGLASHGNIPVETSVPKLLNSNKVFCLSRDAGYGGNN